MNLTEYWTCLRCDLMRWEENHPITALGQEAKSHLDAMIGIGLLLENMSVWSLRTQGPALLQRSATFQQWLETQYEAHAEDLAPLVQVYLLHLDRYAQGKVVSNRRLLNQGSQGHREEAGRRSQRLKQLRPPHRWEEPLVAGEADSPTQSISEEFMLCAFDWTLVDPKEGDSDPQQALASCFLQ